MSSSPWFAPRIALSTKRTRVLTIVSFLLPLLIWSAISYLPFLWHPKIKIVEPGDVSYFKINMLVDREVFDKETLKVKEVGKVLPIGTRANPIYLPAPPRHLLLHLQQNHNGVVNSGCMKVCGTVSP